MSGQPTVAEVRVLAALAVLGWPDDRESIASWPPPGNTYELMSRVIAAADAAGRVDHPDWSHRVQFGVKPTSYEVIHPEGCDRFTCPVLRVADCWPELARLAGELTEPARFELAANDLRDRLLIGDRVDIPPDIDQR